MAHSDDVILSEAQFIIIVTLKVQQSLCPSPSVTRHHQKVFMISLVALHGVIWGQVLERRRKDPNSISAPTHQDTGCKKTNIFPPNIQEGNNAWLNASTYSVGMPGVQTVEVLCSTSYSLPQSSHQLSLLNIFGFQGFSLIFPKQQRCQCGLPAQRLPPHHLSIHRNKMTSQKSREHH